MFTILPRIISSSPGPPPEVELDRIPELVSEMERLRGGAVAATDVRRYYDDEEAHAVVYLREPIHSGYVLVRRDHLANVTSLEDERWTRAHPEFCQQMASGSFGPRCSSAPPWLSLVAATAALPAEVELDRIPRTCRRESCPSALMCPR